MNTDFGPLMQQGYIVKDVHQTANEWVKRVDIGPFYILDRIVMDNYSYRGVRTALELRLAFAYWGSVQIELIQQLNNTDTLYSRALQTSAGQLNHCAAIVTDLDALLARRQLQDQVIHTGKMPTGLKFAYLNEYLPGGQHLELIEAQESTLQAFSGMQAIAQRWDGSRPLRSMTEDLGKDLAALMKP